MTILNLGCGVKTCASADVVNVDWSIYLRMKRNPVLRAIAPLVLRGNRLERFRSLPANVLLHDLSKGIPFAADSIDVVYHSHVLEHLDRDVAPRFLREVKRVLRPGGIQRIVAPDFELACRRYLAHLEASDKDPAERDRHEAYVAQVIEQSVRKEGVGTAGQTSSWRRWLENRLLGDARGRGETHQWMYDRVNLTALLTGLGFREPQIHTFSTSRIPNWKGYGLDTDDSGNEYKPGSLYVEVVKQETSTCIRAARICQGGPCVDAEGRHRFRLPTADVKASMEPGRLSPLQAMGRRV